ncbi:MAG TPA: penicillin acylase family protein, partial [Thermoanaerobaculia bacterium]
MRRPLVRQLAALLAFAALPPIAAAAEPPAEKAGVIATVRSLRDSLDIPHIFGSTDRDVLYALGRAHARDRFFQMDVLRHEFSGTLAEMVGET